MAQPSRAPEPVETAGGRAATNGDLNEQVRSAGQRGVAAGRGSKFSDATLRAHARQRGRQTRGRRGGGASKAAIRAGTETRPRCSNAHWRRNLLAINGATVQKPAMAKSLREAGSMSRCPARLGISGRLGLVGLPGDWLGNGPAPGMAKGHRSEPRRATAIARLIESPLTGRRPVEGACCRLHCVHPLLGDRPRATEPRRYATPRPGLPPNGPGWLHAWQLDRPQRGRGAVNNRARLVRPVLPLAVAATATSLDLDLNPLRPAPPVQAWTPGATRSPGLAGLDKPGTTTPERRRSRGCRGARVPRSWAATATPRPG